MNKIKVVRRLMEARGLMREINPYNSKQNNKLSSVYRIILSLIDELENGENQEGEIMTKDELIAELVILREDMMSDVYESFDRKDLREKVRVRVNELLKKAVNSDIPNCSDCEAMKKVDNLADAIEQAVLISEACKRPFKVTCFEQKLKGDNDEL